MENEKPNNAVQQKVAQLAARMADLFMPCDGGEMIIGYGEPAQGSERSS